MIVNLQTSIEKGAESLRRHVVVVMRIAVFGREKRCRADEFPAGLQYAHNFRSAGKRIANMLKNRDRHNSIERVLVKRKSLTNANHVRRIVVNNFIVDDIAVVRGSLTGSTVKD